MKVSELGEKLYEYLAYLRSKKDRGLVERALLVVYVGYKKVDSLLLKSENTSVSKLYLRARGLSKGEFNLVTYQDLVAWTLDWVKGLPDTYDVIVGIPRGGLLVATLIALRLGKPLSTPELLSQGRYWSSDRIGGVEKPKNVLLVDDSISIGKTMADSLRLLRSKGEFNITTATLIASERSKELVDLNYKTVPNRRILEWALTHQKGLSIAKIAIDLDGVICEDCPSHIDRDEELYVKWISNAKPLLIPTYKIDMILSNRLEKYRPITEEWLVKNKVCYDKLFLWNIESKEERNSKWAQHKIDVLLVEKPDLMYESDPIQAKEIWEATKIPILCPDKMIIFN